MKRNVITILLLLFVLSLSAQDAKFGEVSANDVSSTVCSADESAPAEILNENSELTCELIGGRYAMVTSYSIRIKVFKTAGLEQATIIVPLRAKDQIAGISGYTYNMENGIMQRTELTKECIFEEQSSSYVNRVKIAMPKVVVGSVFELKYQITTPYYTYIDDFYFQTAIPVRYSKYIVTLPDYFKYTKRIMGFEKVKYSEHADNIGSSPATKMVFEAANLPALKSDSYVWGLNDFKSKVHFDLISIQYPNTLVKNLATTWEDIDKRLLDGDSFGKQMSYSNLLKSELQSAVKPTMTDEQKVDTVLKLVREKIRWNERKSLYANDVKAALKEGKGSSSDMNALLICLLKDIGFDAYPVAMRMRGHGRLFIYHPSISTLSYFVVGVDTKEGPLYMDASSRYGAINVLRDECMVENARSIRKDGKCEWIDLRNIARNTRACSIVAHFDSEGVLTGTIQEQLTGIMAMNLCTAISKYNSQDEYVDAKEKELNMTMNNFTMSGCGEHTSTIKYDFKRESAVLRGQMGYIYPLLFFAMADNPFKSETRKLPIEFGYPYRYMVLSSIQMPDGYELEELPQPAKMSLNDGEITYSYIAQQQGQTLNVVQQFTLKETLYAPDEYEHIRNLWNGIADKSKVAFVLKRTQPVKK